jgi:hypothetical protein
LTVFAVALAGCHVFETLDIPCTAGMPCASPTDSADTGAGPDSGEPPDTGQDSGDTAPEPGSPVRGLVVSVEGSTGARVRVYDPVGVLRAQWSGFGAIVGPVAFDPRSGHALVVGPADSRWLNADASSAEGPPTDGTTPVAVLFADGAFQAVWSTRAAALSFGATALTAPYEEREGLLRGAAAASDGGLWLSRRPSRSDAADLLRLLPDGTSGVAYLGFDLIENGRDAMVLEGPGGSPYVCSARGEPYAVDDLARGRVAPAVTPDVALDDVSACAYDPGDGSWLAFSPTRGAYRFDAAGRGTAVVSVPSGYTFVAGTFY